VNDLAVTLPIVLTATAPAPLDARGGIALAAALGTTPESVISVHLLRRGLAQAYVAGRPARFAAAIVRNLAYATDELTAFGWDPDAVWHLLRGLDGWRCIEVDPAVAPAVADRIAATGTPPRFLTDLYHVADNPIPPVLHRSVRLLTPADCALLVDAPPLLRGAGFGSIDDLLAHGFAAAALVGDAIVSLAHTSARADDYADIGVGTLPAWRGRGLATAAAALVTRAVQAAGQVPVWSTGEDNLASLRMARKLRFREVARRVYIIRADVATGAGA
jgi:hypothetical protein